MSSPVLFEVLPALARGIGVATLNMEKTLNSLSLPMIDLLTDQLTAWRDDNSIAIVMLQAASDRAFSAGGDIQDLYKSMVEHPGGPNPYADSFFEREYRLDYLIHTYPKPVIVWAHGFVMGGGLGVMAACSDRIGTEQSRIAMPEITIGLFPDAGATWFLAQMPEHLAYFMAWTGCQLNAVDSKRVGLIDHLIAFDKKSLVVAAFEAEAWNGNEQSDRAKLASILAPFQGSETFPPSVLEQHEGAIRQLVTASLADENPAAAFAAGLGSIDLNDKWLARAASSFNGGSPTTARIVVEQIQRARGLSLKETFMLELNVALQCARHPDFAEGIRALLIDRDNNPAWAHVDATSVPSEYVAEHFRLPMSGPHPLADLDAAPPS